MRLNWFSPLPPARTEIAHYTARLVRPLGERAEVTLWTTQEEWDSGLETYAAVRRAEPGPDFWAELNRGDMSVYHVGNNTLFHDWIWRMSRAHPGVVVLHDLSLHHFFSGLYSGEAEGVAQYLAHIEFYYGEEGRGDVEARLRRGAPDMNYLAEQYPLTLLALEGALGVLVHTPGAFDVLKKEGRWPVAYAPLPYAADAARRRPTAPGGEPHHLIIFGHLGDNRRLDALLKALAESPARARFHLDIYGQLWDKDRVLALIGSLGIQHHVTVHGFVTEEELDRALGRASLAINLRYPTMGEASASQLRIWANGLPSLVTRVGWYATLPPESVAFVRPEHEAADIQAHLNAFLEDPERFRRMGERGRRALDEEHRPEVYVQAVLDLAERARSFRPLAAAYRLAERAGASLRAWSDPYALGRVVGKVAGELHALAGEPGRASRA